MTCLSTELGLMVARRKRPCCAGSAATGSVWGRGNVLSNGSASCFPCFDNEARGMTSDALVRFAIGGDRITYMVCANTYNLRMISRPSLLETNVVSVCQRIYRRARKEIRNGRR